MKIPSRKDIGRRVRAKSLKKRQADQKQNPEKYIHETSEYSKYLAWDYDYKSGALSPYKLEEYLKLKEKYGAKK